MLRRLEDASVSSWGGPSLGDLLLCRDGKHDMELSDL